MFLATVFSSVLFTMSTFIYILLFLVLENQFKSNRHVAGSKLSDISIALRSSSRKTRPLSLPLHVPVPSHHHAPCRLWAILDCCNHWANSSDWQYVEYFFFLSHFSCWPRGHNRLSKLWSHCWHSYCSDFDRVSRHRSVLLFLQFLRIVLLLFPGPMWRRRWR